jgi:dihydroneopterin aldolase
MNTFTITLDQCAFFAYHGIYDVERRDGNDFFVDVSVVINARSFEQSGNLSHTVDYQVIYKIVEQKMTVATPLLETIAIGIVKDIEESFNNILEVCITIYKSKPLLGGICKSSKVTYSKKY